MKALRNFSVRRVLGVATLGIVGGLVAAGLAVPAQADEGSPGDANIIVDGTFTYPEATAGGFDTYFAGDRFGGWSGNAWVVTNGSIDLLSAGWIAPPADTPTGTQSVDLSGWGPGTLTQSIGTVPAAQYEVSFSYSANTDCSPTTKTASVSFSGVQGPGVSISASLGSDPGWKTYSTTVTASGHASDLVIAGTSPGACGVIVTDVSVTQLSPLSFLTPLLGLG